MLKTAHGERSPVIESRGVLCRPLPWALDARERRRDQSAAHARPQSVEATLCKETGVAPGLPVRRHDCLLLVIEVRHQTQFFVDLRRCRL
jgi:hypothetical protein